jgi:hypothetical protein
MTTRFIDLRALQSDPLPPRVFVVNGKRSVTNLCKLGPDKKVVKRNMKDITGICFHQTACVFGAPNKKDPESKYRRALDVPCHGVGFMDGTAVLPCDLSWLVYHGNAFNEDTIGLEFEGHYSGLLDDPKTPRREDLKSIWKGKDPTPLTEIAIQCFRDLTKRVVEEARAMGAPIEFAYAHRQSNGDKESDPGEGIWKHVVLEYAVPVLGLKTVPEHTRRDGKQIPKQWDPAAKVSY